MLINANEKLWNVGGLGGIRSAESISIDGPGLETLEGFGMNLESIGTEESYVRVNPEKFCLTSEELARLSLLHQNFPQLELPLDATFDPDVCRACSPACENEDVVCDYRGRGMCACPERQTGGPTCGSIAQISMYGGGGGEKISVEKIDSGTGKKQFLLSFSVREPAQDMKVDVISVQLHRSINGGSVHENPAQPRVQLLNMYETWTAGDLLQSNAEFFNDTHGQMDFFLPVKRSSVTVLILVFDINLDSVQILRTTLKPL